MKRENPLASMGALQQMSMSKIAEMKAEREQEEHEQKQREEEERLRKQTIARKYVDKWVGKIHDTSHAEQRRRSDSVTSQGSDDNQVVGYIAPVSLPTGTRVSMLMRRNSDRRRISVDSSTGHASLADTSRSTNEDMYVQAGLVPGADDQGGNFAPKKSVGDMSRLVDNSDDKSVDSCLTDMSGLFIDESISVKSRATRIDGEVYGGEKPYMGDEPFRETDADVSERAKRKSSFCCIPGAQDLIEPFGFSRYEVPRPGSSTPEESRSVLSTAELSQSEVSRTKVARSEMPRAEVNGHISDYSHHSYSTLIVGFMDHVEEEDGDDGLIVGFGDRTNRP
jgi:hypothetical protein